MAFRKKYKTSIRDQGIMDVLVGFISEKNIEICNVVLI